MVGSLPVESGLLMWMDKPWTSFGNICVSAFLRKCFKPRLATLCNHYRNIARQLRQMTQDSFRTAPWGVFRIFIAPGAFKTPQ